MNKQGKSDFGRKFVYSIFGILAEIVSGRSPVRFAGDSGRHQKSGRWKSRKTLILPSMQKKNNLAKQANQGQTRSRKRNNNAG